MSEYPQFGAGLWHFASYVDRYATDGYAPPVSTLEQIARAGAVGDLSVVDVPYPFTEGVTVEQVKAALKEHGLEAIGVTPEIYMRRFSKGASTKPDAAVRAGALEVLNEAAAVVRDLSARYLKVWPGQDGWDYPFQVNHHEEWELAVSGMRNWPSRTPTSRSSSSTSCASRATRCSGTRQPRRCSVSRPWEWTTSACSWTRSSLYGGESPAAAAQLLIDHGLLWGMDVNDNLRGWDDDMVVGQCTR